MLELIIAPCSVHAFVAQRRNSISPQLGEHIFMPEMHGGT